VAYSGKPDFFKILLAAGAARAEERGLSSKRERSKQPEWAGGIDGAV